MIRFLPLLAVLLLAGCAGAASKSDPEVLIRISNAGAEPLQCRMMFGHWVDRDLGAATRRAKGRADTSARRMVLAALRALVWRAVRSAEYLALPVR